MGLDDQEKREDSVRDIGAFLEWTRAQEWIDSDRIAIKGGSYGGYMTLATCIHYGERFALRCALESVGISHWVTFLENTSEYRRDLRRIEYGDERKPEMRTFLHDISPLTRAHLLKTPLMVVQVSFSACVFVVVEEFRVPSNR
jgi:dipeptidyl aminopeptidase/acylaminoacyl peptidase